MSLSLSHWYPAQVWYLIVSIPDLCTLTYFYGKCHHDANFLFCFYLKSNCLLELTAIFNETTTINIKEHFLKEVNCILLGRLDLETFRLAPICFIHKRLKMEADIKKSSIILLHGPFFTVI